MNGRHRQYGPVHVLRSTAARILHRRRVTWWFLLALIVLTASRLVRQGPAPPERYPFDDGAVHRVQRVIDGDTLLLIDRTRVRLIGINTPETKHPDRPVSPLGLEAADYLRGLVEGKDVRLTYDQEQLDQYDRVLAYVWLDQLLLNEAIIRAGFSRAQTRFPYRAEMKQRFRLAEQQAREARAGMWRDSAAETADR